MYNTHNSNLYEVATTVITLQRLFKQAVNDLLGTAWNNKQM